jgi:hypothetical protein
MIVSVSGKAIGQAERDLTRRGSERTLSSLQRIAQKILPGLQGRAKSLLESLRHDLLSDDVPIAS